MGMVSRTASGFRRPSQAADGAAEIFVKAWPP
jgi:hypothetical protein